MNATSTTAAALAELIDEHRTTGLIAFDVDGVLAPIVAHADQSVLTPGVDQALQRLADDSAVAIISGRSLANLEAQFEFAESLHVIGSHGIETRGVVVAPLTDAERFALDQLHVIGQRGVRAAGQGAWLERKPASVVVHVREADNVQGDAALQAVTRLASVIVGAHVKAGSSVVELLARTANKGDALLGLAAQLDRDPIIYFGDDVTDEDAFAVMGPDDVSVRVGPGDTCARFRLEDPAAVAELLALLTAD